MYLPKARRLVCDIYSCVEIWIFVKTKKIELIRYLLRVCLIIRRELEVFNNIEKSRAKLERSKTRTTPQLRRRTVWLGDGGGPSCDDVTAPPPPRKAAATASLVRFLSPPPHGHPFPATTVLTIYEWTFNAGAARFVPTTEHFMYRIIYLYSVNR